MNTYLTHSGTGFQFEESDLNLKELISLLMKSPKTAKMLKDDDVDLFDENITLEAINESMNITEVIAEILNEAKDVESFYSVSDDDGYYYVIFVDKAPWEYTEKEKLLTKNEVVNSFKTILAKVISNIEIEDLYIANYIND